MFHPLVSRIDVVLEVFIWKCMTVTKTQLLYSSLDGTWSYTSFYAWLEDWIDRGNTSHSPHVWNTAVTSIYPHVTVACTFTFPRTIGCAIVE